MHCVLGNSLNREEVLKFSYLPLDRPEQSTLRRMQENRDDSDIEHHKQMLRRLECENVRLSRLPSTSAYAVHRRKCVSRAIELLQVILTDRSNESNSLQGKDYAADELSELLETLSLK